LPALTTQTTDLISVDEAAETYNLSRATIFRLIGDDKLKPWKLRIGDRKTYVSKAALKKLMGPKEKS
jgi:excisionase family DNA binding protein